MSARRLLTQKYHNRLYSDSIKIYTIQCANFASPTNLSISSRLGNTSLKIPFLLSIFIEKAQYKYQILLLLLFPKKQFGEDLL